jgi:CBS domain-containing protein
MPTRNVSLAEVGPLARDVMLRSPDTVPADMTVAAARGMLESPRLRMLLVAEGDRLIGAISRERLAAEPDGDITLGRLADPDSPRVSPDETVAHVLEVLEDAGAERLPVVDQEERLLGLVCFNRGKRHFCLDAD